MTQEGLGRAQAFLTIATVLGAVGLAVGYRLLSEEARRGATAAGRAFTWLSAAFLLAIAVAFLVIGTLQLRLATTSYAVLNVALGIALVLAVVRRLRGAARR